MSNIVTIQEPRGVVATMADKFSMRADTFEATVRAQCSPAPRRGEEPVPLTREEFAAFILVANHYDLNPLTREIYAYPKRGGGIVPVVSIDGWISLINRQQNCDGYDLIAEFGEKRELISYTCTMYRKDRSHPVVVTEYLVECIRDTEPWKMRHRMLRHKALIQGGRYAFGFAGIYDQDEAERIASADEARQVRRVPAPPTSHIAVIEHKSAIAMDTPATETRDPVVTSGTQTPSPTAQRRPPAPPSARPMPVSPAFDFTAHKARAIEALAKAASFDDCDDVFARFAQNWKANLSDEQYMDIRTLVADRQEAFEPKQAVEWAEEQ